MSQVVTTPKGISVEFRQHDWCPGFAAYLAGPGPLQPNGVAFCTVNLAGFLGNYAQGVMTRGEMVDEIAKSMVHELVHVMEHWAGIEFSEERVERVLASYEKYAVAPGEDHSLVDGIGALGCAKDGMMVRRRSWDAGIYVDHVADRGNGKPLLRIHRPHRFDAYHPTCDDVLAEDWEIVYPEDGQASDAQA